MSNENIRQEESGVAVAESTPETKKPRMYKVVILNDDYTPMDFVVQVLKRFFHKTTEQATKVMLEIHYEGQGTAGIYTGEIAETKVALVNDFSRANDHPLMCTMEAE
ncbi:ATP-dependent Clp protease adapter ClpS [Aliikangiella sp. IMCC44359]|uniref:ATP-dependent Clp protease adapter ClpS n=1 Tax=Aliikangiella sp. IMCC44359 TaxID=3459125 RepID=UPI00403B2087